MELTRDKLLHIDLISADPEKRELASALIAEMDAPKIWDNAPKDATFASVHYAIESGKPYPECSEARKAYFYYRVLPKSRIDEIAEEAANEITHDKYSVQQLSKTIKSAILKDREERGS